jgi:hypothetical protein
MPTQRYVSPELTHFVGEGLGEDEQYSVLVKDILKTGWLKHTPTNPTPNEFLKSGTLVSGTQSRGDTEAMYSQRVCFCDIPVTDLEIHMNKYSRFGLSFLKRFLIDKGANPVLYVANNSPALPFGLPGTESREGPWPRRDVFQGNVRLYQDFHWERMAKFPPHLDFFLSNFVFSFIKYFDDSTSDENEANVYMEREWRVLGDVNFALADVHRVFMPQRYAERFRADLPNYVGQLTFSDSI